MYPKIVLLLAYKYTDPIIYHFIQEKSQIPQWKIMLLISTNVIYYSNIWGKIL